MTLEQRLIDHAAAIRFDDLGRPAVDAAKREILWTLGTSVAGSRDLGSDNVLDVVRRLAQGASGSGTIIGAGTEYPAVLAGFANGVYAKALEYEDKHWMGNTHAYAVGVGVVPAAFAMAEHLGGVSGRDLLTAVTVATDVQMRLVNAAPHAIDTPFNSTYMFCHFGAALAAGILMGLGRRQLLDALSLAGTQAAGTYQAHHEGTLAVRMQMGFCVRNGLYAAVMAESGIRGPQRFLTGRHGLYPAFFDECDEAAAVADLGTVHMGSRLGFKGYPCCAAMHQALDAVYDLKNDHDFAAQNVVAVEIHGAPSMAITCRPIEAKRRPTNHVEQEFSLPWAVASALTRSRLSFDDFRDTALDDAARLTLAGRVSAELDAPDDGVYAVITLDDGRTLRSRPVAAPTGHPDNPHTWSEIVERYRDCVRYGPDSLTADRTEQVKDVVTRLDESDDACHAIRLLA